MTATLEWALGPDGQPRSASWFVGIDPRDRPRMTCPCAASDGTRHEVLAKAGESGKVTPHFAHLPDSSCAATNPETAEHYNAKMRLASILGDADGLYISARCKAGHRVACLWSARSWLSAVPEFSVGTRRPDVVLLGRDREVIGAIEVLHSHAVDARKARDLATWGVRWIEVRSIVALEWRSERPLHIAQCDAETWNEITAACDECALRSQETSTVVASASSEPFLKPHELAAMARKFKSDLESRRPRRDRNPDDVRVNARHFMIEYLMRNPPKLRVVTAFAVDVVARCAVVSAGAINGKAMHTKTLRGMADDDLPWLMLDHAIALVERHIPGKPAAFLVDSFALTEKANCPTVDELPKLDALRRRVCDALHERRSIVIPKPMRFAEHHAPSAWVLKAQTAADEELRRVLSEATSREASP
jgi:hypothetical protein